MPKNRLDGETSPYLLQHRENPVHWQPWGTAALAEAERSGKPILLSVGYAACHWCHVMAHESFEDPAIAATMNELFVNIKVDREERPDIDAIYQAALALLGEHGGWPLTMFLTAKGEPFWGGTYFPPQPRFGRPGFTDVLRRVAAVYRDHPDSVRHNVGTLLTALGDYQTPRPGGAVTFEVIDTIAARLVREIDPVNGGIGTAPKFPQPALFELLWRRHKRGGDEACRAAVILSLDRICQGGIYDHLGGGFSRYTVDAAWLVPHFEKMLYDNAQLIAILTLVWQDTRAPLYSQRIGETIEWLLREMRHDGGGFYSSQDADSDGVEGKFYVWTEPEIDAVLGPDAAAFKTAYGVTPGGNWEGRNILNRSHRPSLGDSESEARLQRCRAHLWRQREDRPKPGLDDKILADWNGLMIAALADAAFALDQPPWLHAAARAFAFVDSAMTADGRLRHSWRAGRAVHPAILDDYANMARAALALYEAHADGPYLDRARAWVEIADRHYRDRGGGGYYLSADDTADLLTRPKSAVDQAVPAGNATMVAVLARLYYHTGNDAYRQRAEETVRAFSGELGRNFFPLATLLNSAAFLLAGCQVVLIGQRDATDTRALLRAVSSISLPDRILRLVEPDDELPADHPAHGKARLGDKATAYVCRGPVCSLPLTDPAALAQELARP